MSGQVSGNIIILENAEMIATDDRQIPSADAPWEPIALPHAWFRHPPAVGRVIWYRIPFELAEKPRLGHALFLRRMTVTTMDFYLNGRLLAPHTDIASTGVSVTAMQLRIPLDRLEQGRNVLHVRVSASTAAMQGMPRVHVGPIDEIRVRAARWRLAQSEIITIFGFGFGMIGLLSLVLWLADRDEAMLWYGATGAAFGLVTLAWYVSFPGGNLAVILPMIYARFFGFFTPMAVLQLRLSGRRWPWAEAFLWLGFAAAWLSMAIPNPWQPTVWSLSGLIFPGVLMVCSLALLRPLIQIPAINRTVLALSGFAGASFGVYDALRATGYLDFDGPIMNYYLIPVFMVGTGAAIFERFIAGVRRLRDSNLELESRVAAKSREIALAHEQRAAAERERALAGERRRIMADMHDVLGSRLIGLLSLVQSGKAPREQLEQELAASLDELRMTIDSVQPVEGDLGVVLGNVRHRMRSVFGATGVALDWQVGDLPAMEALTPARVLAIQRLLLEVFTNVLKHSAAKTVRVSTATVDGTAQIVIEDDGRGFEAGRCSGGHGIGNLSTRAAEAGGTLDISTVRGDGTRVTLTLPLGHAGLPSTG